MMIILTKTTTYDHLKANIHSAAFCNMNFHYRVLNSSPLVPILSQINPVHTCPLYFSNIRSNIVIPSASMSSHGDFPSGSPTKILYVFRMSHACYMPCPFHPPWFEASHSLCSFLQPPAISFLLGPNILLSILFWIKPRSVVLA